MSEQLGQKMEEDVPTSVAIEPLNVYPDNCDSVYGPELCKQLNQMQDLAKSLNTNISSLVQQYEEAVQDYDRVFKNLQLAKATGTTTSATLKKLENDKTVLEKEKNRLQNRLNLLQQSTLPNITTYMSKVNEVIGKKRKLAPQPRPIEEISPTDIFSLLVYGNIKQAETTKERRTAADNLKKFKEGYYATKGQTEKTDAAFVQELKNNAETLQQTLDIKFVDDVKRAGPMILQESTTFDDEMRKKLANLVTQIS